MTEACDLDATEARRLIGLRALSSAELTESCIARIEAVDPAVNAMAARDFERARAAAAACDAAVAQGGPLGPLHGLPLGVKDLDDVAGLRTTYGSPLFRDHVPTRDQGTVARCRAAGAIVLGKTNTPEWGAGANTRNSVFGATGNPFDPTRSAAGSSGGSAVALATGMVPIATGSDMGGSLRNPAAFSGIVGFRPSPGMVPSETRSLGWNPLSVLGPMARTVPDLCLLLSCMAEHDGRDPLSFPGSRPPALPATIDLAGLRVAITPDFGFAPVEHGIAATFAAVIARLRPVFARADDASPDCAGTDEVFEVLRATGALAAHGDRVRATPDQVGPNIHRDVERGLAACAADVAQAMKQQTVLYRRWQRFFDEYDIILSPAVAISPRPWTELFPAEINGAPTRTYFHWLALAYAVTVVGHPAMSLPVGLDQAGMPFGLQIVGPRHGDAAVLAIGAALERLLANDPLTARPRPDLAMLQAAPPIAKAPGFMGFGAA